MIAIIFLLLLVLLFGLIGLGTVFWIMMLLDATRRKDWKNDNENLLWVVLMLVVGVIGSLVYYFEIYSKRGKAKG